MPVVTVIPVGLRQGLDLLERAELAEMLRDMGAPQEAIREMLARLRRDQVQRPMAALREPADPEDEQL